MRIAYFVDRFPLISETFVLAQIIGMIDRGHDVRIFANREDASEIRHSTVDRYDLPGKTTYVPFVGRTFFARVLPALRILLHAARTGCLRAALRTLDGFRLGRDAINLKLLLKAAPHLGGQEFDILHCQFGQLATDIPALQRCGVLVTSFRGTDAMKIASRDPSRFQDLFRSGNVFLCVSRAVAARLECLGCPPEKIRLMRSGIDLSRFAYRGETCIHDPVRVVSIGRLAPNKGLDYGIRAIKHSMGLGHRIEYRLIGDGPAREALQDLVADLDLTDVVIFEGAVDAVRVAAHLREADVLLAPSITGPNGEQEGLPNSPKEAMAIGVPVIATDIGGIPELVADGETGFLVAERDAQALSARLCEVIDAWSGLDRIIKAARLRIEDEFDIRVLNDQLHDVYASLVR